MQEFVVNKSQEAVSSLTVTSITNNSQPVKCHPMQEVIQILATLAEENTVFAYQKVAVTTWEIFKQASNFIFFLFCLLIALIIWGCGIFFQSGLHFRNWLEVKQPTVNEMISLLLKYLIWPLKRAYEWADGYIKENLGWDNPFTAKLSANQSKDTTVNRLG